MMREMSGKASTGREESKNVCPPIWSSFFCAQRVELGGLLLKLETKDLLMHHTVRALMHHRSY